MVCPNCKNPIQEISTECEWCNFVLKIENKKHVNTTPLSKGECLFFSKRIKKTQCFYEIHEDGIKIFDRDEKINLYIKREIIYNIEKYKPYLLLHFLPVLGSFVRMCIIKFSNFRKGFSIITSKSGNNIIIIKNINYFTFNRIISYYIKY